MFLQRKKKGTYRRRVTRPEEGLDFDEELPDELPLLIDLPEEKEPPFLDPMEEELLSR